MRDGRRAGAPYSGRMNLRRIPTALCIVSLAALAACSPADEERADVRRDSAATAVRTPPPTGTNYAQTANRPPAQRPPERAAASDPTAILGAAPAAGMPRVDDAQITAKVKAGLAAARDLGGARIDVDTRDGVVTLSGPVQTAAVKARASEIARQVQDVRDVNDQLTLVMS